MLDQDNLRPVIISMSLYLVIATLIPRYVNKPTGVDAFDDLVMTLIAQKESLMSGTLLIGFITFATNYIIEELI